MLYFRLICILLSFAWTNTFCSCSESPYEPITTIQIYSTTVVPSQPQPPRKTQYDSSFGRGMIFDYRESNGRQLYLAESMVVFSKSILDIDVTQNPILVGISIENSKSVLQHMFFSGNAEAVIENAFLNIGDLKTEFGTPSFEQQEGPLPKQQKASRLKVPHEEQSEQQREPLLVQRKVSRAKVSHEKPLSEQQKGPLPKQQKASRSKITHEKQLPGQQSEPLLVEQKVSEAKVTHEEQSEQQSESLLVEQKVSEVKVTHAKQLPEEQRKPMLVQQKASGTKTNKKQSRQLETPIVGSKSRPVIKKVFIKNDRPTDYAEKRTLECLVKSAFPDIFWNQGQRDFFFFPVHQAFLVSNLANSETKGTDCTDLDPLQITISPDSITCEFREFIYSYFVDENIMLRQVEVQSRLMLLISKNIVTHANHHSSSQVSNDIQKNILNTTLQEYFVRNDQGARTILKEIFGEDEFDSIFGSTEEKIQHLENVQDSKESKMNWCFQHSEQAFLNNILSRKKAIEEFIIEYFFERIVKNKNFDGVNIANVEIESESVQTILETTKRDQVQSVGDDDIDIAIQVPVKLGVQKVLAKSFQFTFAHPVVLDIISPRHICKFCRGSLHLRCKEIQQMIEKGITIVPIQERVLSKFYENNYENKLPVDEENAIQILGINSYGFKNKPSRESHDKLYSFCIDHRHEAREYSDFISNYQKFTLYEMINTLYPELLLNGGNLNIELKNVQVEICATSFMRTGDDLMGIPNDQ